MKAASMKTVTACGMNIFRNLQILRMFTSLRSSTGYKIFRIFTHIRLTRNKYDSGRLREVKFLIETQNIMRPVAKSNLKNERTG